MIASHRLTCVYSWNRHDGRLKCVCYWTARKSLICGTADGELLVFPLPAHVLL